MYKCRYEADSGLVFHFDYAYGVIFDLDPLGGLEIDMHTAQGFGQVGETLESQSAPGVVRRIRGYLMQSVAALKQALMDTFLPMSGGSLIFNDKYAARCYVRMTPLIQAGSKYPLFELELYSPNPYWYDLNSPTVSNQQVSQGFKFPVNYGEPHTFGSSYTSIDFNVQNDGVATSEFVLTFEASGTVVNPRVVDLDTMQHIGLTGTIGNGEVYTIYRENGRLYVEKEVYSVYSENNRMYVDKAGGRVTSDAFGMLDYTSDLYTLHAGLNRLRVQADSGVSMLVVSVNVKTAVAGVYDGM